MARIVINAIIAKRIAGGGFQIALNFFKAISHDSSNEFFFWVSEDLNEALIEQKISFDKEKYYIFQTQPNYKTYLATRKQIKSIEKQINPDIIYSILAPSYFFFRKKEVMRCSNAWDVIEHDNIAYSVLSLSGRLKCRLKSFFVRLLMKKCHYFITQTEAGKKGIMRVTGTSSNFVKVVPNVLPLYYQSVNIKKSPHQGLNVVYVANSSAHKNISIVVDVAYFLLHYYHISDFKIILTIPNNASVFWEDIKKIAEEKGVSHTICNVGYQKQSELALLYQKCDIGFFPSLLETFSATLLEYMFFGLPIVASDFEFNKEVAKDAALYFEPKNAEDAASKISELYFNGELRHSFVEKGKMRVRHYSDFSSYVKETISFLELIAKQ